jgi:hypothetical protein
MKATVIAANLAGFYRGLSRPSTALKPRPSNPPRT